MVRACNTYGSVRSILWFIHSGRLIIKWPNTSLKALLLWNIDILAWLEANVWWWIQGSALRMVLSSQTSKIRSGQTQKFLLFLWDKWTKYYYFNIFSPYAVLNLKSGQVKYGQDKSIFFHTCPSGQGANKVNVEPWNNKTTKMRKYLLLTLAVFLVLVFILVLAFITSTVEEFRKC